MTTLTKRQAKELVEQDLGDYDLFVAVTDINLATAMSNSGCKFVTSIIDEYKKYDFAYFIFEKNETCEQIIKDFLEGRLKVNVLQHTASAKELRYDLAARRSWTMYKFSDEYEEDSHGND